MKRIYGLLGIIIASFFLAQCSTGGRWTIDDERVVTKDPVQINLAAKQEFRHKEYSVFPQADFEIEARVLCTHRYFFGREAELAPVDLALGWKQMSDCSVLKKLKITQWGRRYFYRWPHSPPIPPEEIIAESGNMHLIPATKKIKKQIKRTKRGEIVRFKGVLVQVKAKDGWFWNSSLSRTDTANHSCELVWVEEFRKIN